MTLYLSLAVSGIVSGAMIGLIALGIVLVHRTTRVVNFAHGAIAMAATYVYFLLDLELGVPRPLAFVGAIFGAALVGLAIFATVERIPREETLSRVMMTVAWLTGLQAVAVVFIKTPQRVNGILPNSGFTVGTFTITFDQIGVVIIAAGLSVGLAALLRRSRLGLQMRAVSENPDAAAMAGLNVKGVLAATWIIGSSLAAVAGVLISPLLVLDPTILPILILAQALAAAVVGRLHSLPVTMAAAVGLGLASSLLTGVVTPANSRIVGSMRTAIPLIMVTGALYVATSKGRSLDVA